MNNGMEGVEGAGQPPAPELNAAPFGPAEAPVLDAPPPDNTWALMSALRNEYLRGLSQLQAVVNEMAASHVASSSAASASASLPAGCKPTPPANFTGKRDSDSIDTWLFSCDQYFKLTGLTSDSLKVQYVGTLLRGPAQVWFRMMSSSDELLQLISTWPAFCCELRANFCPTNTVKLTRDRLAYMKQTSASTSGSSAQCALRSRTCRRMRSWTGL